LTIAAVSWVLLALLGWVIQSVTSKRVLPPLRGSTRMMLPIVWSRCAEGKMVCGALQLRPPSWTPPGLPLSRICARAS